MIRDDLTGFFLTLTQRPGLTGLLGDLGLGRGLMYGEVEEVDMSSALERKQRIAKRIHSVMQDKIITSVSRRAHAIPLGSLLRASLSAGEDLVKTKNRRKHKL